MFIGEPSLKALQQVRKNYCSVLRLHSGVMNEITIEAIRNDLNLLDAIIDGLVEQPKKKLRVRSTFNVLDDGIHPWRGQ